MSRKKHQSPRPQKLLPAAEQYPSAQTFYRLALLDEHGKALIDQVTGEMIDNEVLSRDAPAVDKIRAAHTPAELLDLVSISTGLAETAWLQQMRLLRLGAAPLIAERLVASAAMEDSKARTTVEERLVAALYICGGLGAEYLLRSFDSLSLYGQSLACLALGKANAAQAADRIWAYYERVKNYRLELFLVGPLWALIDLKDPRASAALAEMLEAGRDFYELYGMVALAGDERAVLPVLRRFVEAPVGDKDDSAYALAAIAHRIGRAAFRAEFEIEATAEGPATHPDKIVEAFWGISPEAIQDYFQLFYGF